MSTFAGAICLLCLVLGRGFLANPHTVDDALKAHGLPLFAARSVQIRATWDEKWPTQAYRLETTALRLVETKEEVRKLSTVVLLYCSEPGDARDGGDLLLRLHLLGEQMARSSPMAGELLGPHSLPLKAPMKVTLLFLDEHGRVRRSEQREVIELTSAAWQP